jgi:hypothetical protein
VPKSYRRSTLAISVAAAVTGGLMTFSAPAVAAEAEVHGDFNNDGYRDVVASATDAHVGGDAEAGQVVVYWGGPDGLLPDRRTPISQDSPGVPGSPEKGDRFGSMTNAGDFDGDGITDLVVGAPGEDLTGDNDSGMVSVLWGSNDGLVSGDTVTNPTKFDGDRFGQALVAGDFDGDGVDDLAAGSSSVKVVFHEGGIDRAGDATRTRTITTPIAKGHGGVYFLTAGDVDGNGTDDLVVNGLDSQPTGDYIYNVNFYYAGYPGSGVTGYNPSRLTPGLYTGIGDTNGDGYGDLVIGEHWDAGATPDAVKGGKVSIRYGTADGPFGVIKTITQETDGIKGGSENDDTFGAELHLGDVNGDGLQDLAISSMAENLGEDYDTGVVHLLYGSPTGVTTTGAQYLHQNTPGVPGSNEDTDYFGSDVFLSDVTGDGNADLTVGAYGENNGNGAVTALRSDGTKIVTDGAKWIGVTDSGVSSSGHPGLGVNFAG